MAEPTVVEAARERSAGFGQASGLAEALPAQDSLEMFRRICKIRYFESELAKLAEAGHIPALVYLAIGQESIAAAVSMVTQGSWLFTQHRGHSVYLAHGGDPVALADELLGLPSGCCGGKGGSPCIQDPAIKMIGHEGLIAEHVPIAIGTAYASGEPVVCHFGDGAVEEDYFLGVLGFAGTHGLPILLVCEDNDLSVLTPTADRRRWKLAEVAKAFGLEAVDITDDPWLVRQHALRMRESGRPGLLNCRTARGRWHVGWGTDGPPEWDRLALVREQLSALGLASRAAEIEDEMRRWAENLWKERLRKKLEQSPTPSGS